MFCTNCGNALKDGARFCHVCGKPVYVPEETPVAAAPAADTPDPRTLEMKRAYSRAGLSTVALYGTMSVGQSLAVVLIMVLAMTGSLLSRVELPAFGRFFVQDVMEWAYDKLLTPLSVTVLLLGAAAGTALGIVLMRKIVKRGTPIEKRSLSFGRFVLIALICFGIWGVGALLGNLAELFGATQETMFSVENLGKGMLPYLIYAMIGAPILEELAFRKVLLDRLHDFGEGYAAVISALLFGLMHGNHMQFFLAFFLGLVFAMVYQRTGRIVYTMLLHALINTTASIAELFAIFGIDISLGWNIAVGALVLGGLVALLIARKNPLLHTANCTIPDANRAVYKNVGMRIARIAGLALIGLQGAMFILLPLVTSGNPAYLIGLIPLALAFLTVLLLPKFTKRYEAKEETV